MYQKIICKNCEGNGCGSCHKTGVKFVEVDEIDQRYYDNTIRTIVNLSNNNSQLKKQLEIAKEALKFYAENCSVDDFISDCRGDLARQTLKELESAGE